ncbi:MAG: hypothetical protein K8S27_16370 [Candidatus Omnitrophica bacterium]|nr:hypothetical protein [Candidatus Omnitrophota bacterium]
MIIFFLCLLILFPQSSPAQILAQNDSLSPLTAKIIVPYPNSLVRGEVPVYGLASGKGFKEYRLEYGTGRYPDKWILIHHSSQPQKDVKGLSLVNFDMIKTIPGNLGMWITGLTEYEYGDYDVDLPMGTYTLRLQVTGDNAQVKESRVHVDVGRIALNCSPNKIVSPDGLASLFIQEHSLYQVAKVFSLKSLNEVPRGLINSKELSLVSSLYRLRPAGEKFTQKTILKILYNNNKILSSRNIGICVYDTKEKKWKSLETYHDQKGNALQVNIENIQEDIAIYGAFESKRIDNKINTQDKSKMAGIVSPLLFKNTFEDGFDQWRNKHGLKGALLEITEKGRRDGHCLKLTNTPGMGNFAASIYSKGFDARIFPLVEFDYKMTNDVKINLLVKVNNNWYDIIFTDDEKIYWDIDMEKIGEIKGVIKDGRWHRAEFNLYEMLKKRADIYSVQEFVVADWDTTGFKKLEFGSTPSGAQYFIDNFSIRSDKYFWQLGWDDKSANEFGQSLLVKDDEIFSATAPFHKFPSEFVSSRKIKFNVPVNIKKTAYRLTVKLLESEALFTPSKISLYHNGTPLTEKQKLISPLRIDFLLENISPGENTIALRNEGDILFFDYISLFPFGEPPWQFSSISSENAIPYFFVGQMTKTKRYLPLSSFKKNKFAVIFNLAQPSSSLEMRLFPEETAQSTSWLNLKEFNVFVNDFRIRTVTYGTSGKVINVLIPSDHLKRGINIIRFECLSPEQTFSFKKICI